MRTSIHAWIPALAFGVMIAATSDAGAQPAEKYRLIWRGGFGEMTVIREATASKAPKPIVLGLWTRTDSGGCEARAFEDVAQRRYDGESLVATMLVIDKDAKPTGPLFEARFVGNSIYIDNAPDYMLCTGLASFSGRWSRSNP